MNRGGISAGGVTAIFVVVVLVALAYVYRAPLLSSLTGPSSGQTLVATAHYVCDQGKTITASYYSGPAAPTPAPGQPVSTGASQGGPPTPTGSASVQLSDGRSMTLQQTISADGTRYSNGNPQSASSSETFVFWSKGNTAMILEGSQQQQTFSGCISIAADPGNLPNVYESGSNGFSLRYPKDFKPDTTYQYQELGPGKAISGVKFTIDPAIASGTNLAADSYVSVEEIPVSTGASQGGPQAQSCSADQFLGLANGGSAQTVTDNNTTYSVASTTGAGAGNRYFETVYVIPGTNPCIAVRYYIHYGVIENYPPGKVTQFDQAALLSLFDAVRRSLTIGK